MATDGCSIPTFGGPLQAFARAYAVLADPDGACWSGRPEWRAALHRLRAAMVLHPELIGGPESVDTMIMQATGGEVVAKQGAEGLMCLSIPKDGLGIAITDIAGSSRSLGPAALGVLEQLNVLGLAELDCLRAKLLPPVTTFRGLPVGAMRPVVNLHRPSPESQGSVLSPAAVRAGWESPRRLSQ